MIRASHPKYVLDASVAAKWFTRHHEADRQSAVALRALHQAGRCTLVVPEFSLLEIINAIRFGERVEAADAASALRLLEKLRLEIAPLDWGLLRDAAAIAWTWEISLYDAAHVALAERVGFPLVTADEVMARKLKGNSIVVRLAELVFS